MGADSTTPSHARRPPRLLLLVFAASLALIVATAVAVTAVVSNQIADGTVNAVGDADQTLANYFVQQNRLVGPEAAVAGVPTMANTALAGEPGRRRAAPDGRGTRLSGVRRGRRGVRRRRPSCAIKVHAADGTVLFSDEASLRGTNVADDDLTEALQTGEASSSLTTDFGAEEQDLAAAGHTSALEEYLPIKDASGHVLVVFEVYRSSDALLKGIANAQAMVLLVLAGGLAAPRRPALPDLPGRRPAPGPPDGPAAAGLAAGRPDRPAQPRRGRRGAGGADRSRQARGHRPGRPGPGRRRQLPAAQRHARPRGRRHGPAGGGAVAA